MELLRDAKLRGKIKITGGTKATIDGNMKALFSNVHLQKTNSNILEQIERANRYHMSNDLAVMSKENCDVNFADWSDNYYKEDTATTGTAEPSITQAGSGPFAVSSIREPAKRHITATAQDFEIYLADLLNFPRKNHVWYSFAQGGLDFVVTFEKDKNILTYNRQRQCNRRY